MNRVVLICLISVFTFSNIFGQNKNKQPKTKISVLFIGNSLTYANNLPKLVANNAKKYGVKMEVKMIAFPNYAIMDHWNDGKIQQLIAKNKFDYIIIQQGPSSQKNGRNMLIDYGKKFSVISKLNNSKLCFFMVWPSLNYYHTFDGVIKNYTDAARITNSILIPVGKIWKDYFNQTQDHSYYGADGFHPSLKGSKAAAQVIINYLLKKL